MLCRERSLQVTTQTSNQKLVALLQLAYSAEMGAALAYRGHWGSVANTTERTEIRKIEAEEWLHRREVGALLKDLLAHPRLDYELKYFIIGRALGFLCYLTGWFLPMYGAGRMESKNYREYELAAEYALGSGHLDYIDCLLSMAEVEWEHEFYFRGKVESHPWHSYWPIWEALPAKSSIRTNYRSYRTSNTTENLIQGGAIV
jgi:hypothetical protein